MPWKGHGGHKLRGWSPQRQMVRELDSGGRFDRERPRLSRPCLLNGNFSSIIAAPLCTCVRMHTQDTYMWRPDGSLLCCPQHHLPSLFFPHRVPCWPGAHKWTEWLASKLQGAICLRLPNTAHDHARLLSPLSRGSRDETWIPQLRYLHSPEKTYS